MNEEECKTRMTNKQEARMTPKVKMKMSHKLLSLFVHVVSLSDSMVRLVHSAFENLLSYHCIAMLGTSFPW
ncbi:MAG: hypothetical protein GY861_27935 [bacterium]|nr:hypothetical protein [bacterium]